MKKMSVMIIMIIFRNIYLSVRRLQILWNPKEGLKKSFPAVLNSLSDSNSCQLRDTDERNWRRPFIYFTIHGKRATDPYIKIQFKTCIIISFVVQTAFVNFLFHNDKKVAS